MLHSMLAHQLHVIGEHAGFTAVGSVCKYAYMVWSSCEFILLSISVCILNPGCASGTAIVLTTPDANRTFLSYLGEEQDLQLSAASQQAIAASRMLIIEGYMWEVPNVLPTLLSAGQTAARNNAMVALTAGDSGVVHRHRQEIWSMIDAGVDMLFCNR